jgi:hypothetical protein
MTAVERWLNTRGALIAAWSMVAAVVLGAAAFAVYLVFPSGRGGADASLPSGTVAAVAGATPQSGRAVFSGTVERIEGQALLVMAGGSATRVVVRSGRPLSCGWPGGSAPG